MGRPSDYTPELAELICSRIAEGQSVREICRADDMPGQTTIYRWLEAQKPFREQYARAREAQADRFADEILEISDDGTNDWMRRKAATGGGRSEAEGEPEEVVANHEHINRSKLRVDSRKWLMSKMAPKKYGEKLAIEADVTVRDHEAALDELE